MRQHILYDRSGTGLAHWNHLPPRIFFLPLSFHSHYMSSGPMAICQIIIALSAKFEAARGVFSGLLEHGFLSKHQQHQVSIGCLDPSQYELVTTVDGIS